MEKSGQHYCIPALLRGKTSGSHWTGNHVRPTAGLDGYVGVAAVNDATTKRHVVVEADIFFGKEENTREYNRHLQACTPAVHKMRTMTLSPSNPTIPHHYSSKQSIA